MGLRDKLAKLLLGYDAATSSNNRRGIVVERRTEDHVLRPADREKLVSATRDLRRNYSIAAWAIRQHLNYVSSFSFQSKTGIEDLDDQIEKLVRRWSRPQNCDVTGRHGLQQLIRMLEALATTDGDAFLMKLSDGKLQLVEGDRVRNPSDLGEFKDKIDPNIFTHGIELSPEGRARRFAICQRDSGGFNGWTLKSVIDSVNILQHGYFDRYDQCRGISPLASAVNDFTDLYEAKGYALAKMKLSQLFALKLKRGGEYEDADGGSYKFNFGSGPQVLDLDPNDDASFLESNTPSGEFQAFMQTGIGIGLKSLDIPMSFYAENFTNYSGARQALQGYEVSANEKRKRLCDTVLYPLMTWRLGLWVADGSLKLPQGMTVEDIAYEWVPVGIPWIDPLKEATADVLLVQKGLASREDVCRSKGQDWYAIIDKLAAEKKYAAERGINLDDSSITLNIAPEPPDQDRQAA